MTSGSVSAMNQVITCPPSERRGETSKLYLDWHEEVRSKKFQNRFKKKDAKSCTAGRMGQRRLKDQEWTDS